MTGKPGLMKWKITIAALLGVLLAALLHSMRTEPHKFKDCSGCHVLGPGGGVLEGRLTAPISVLCEPCHRSVFTEGYLHPCDIRPTGVTVPADMPLSGQGEMTCATCHDVHMPYESSFGVPSRYLRRYEQGNAFCRICHPAFAHSGRDHTVELGESHFRAQYRSTDPSRAIDPISLDCLSCHDGSYSSSAPITAGLWSHGKDFMKYDGGSHPIGVDYEQARMQKGRKTDLRPIGAVDRRVRFFDGKVGCGSCHDPYSTIEKRLVMSDRESGLCLTCHMIAG